MRTLVLLACALIALSSCMQQPEEKQAGQTPPSTAVQPQNNDETTPATVETAAQEPITVATNSSKRLKELNAIMQSFNPKVKAYTIPSTKISKIKGDKGSVLEVDPKNLENADGSTVTGNIIVEFAEYTSAKDLVFAGAPTMSDGKPLISAGSYFISATNNGKTMRIKNGKDLKLSVATIEDKEMDIFYGQKTADGTVNWKWDSDIFKGESAGGVKQPVTVGDEALSDLTPARKTADAKFNCFNIELEGNNYAVITVGNTIKIKRAENNTQVQYINNTVFPSNTLCVRGFSNKVFRTYKADTTRKGGYVEYVLKDTKGVDAIDTEYIKAIKSTSIKVPAGSVVTRVVPEKYLADTLLTIKAERIRKQEAEAKKLAQKDLASGDWSGFNIGSLPPSTPPNKKDMKVDSVKREAADDLMSKLREKTTRLSVRRFGFVNCDRYVPPVKTMPLVAMFNAEDYDFVSGVLVFKNQLTCLYANYFQDGMVGFQSVPVNTECVLVTFTSINNKLYAQVQDINSSKQKLSLNLKQIENKAFKDLLEASIK